MTNPGLAVLHLYCPLGFSYVHPNYVEAWMGGNNVTLPIAQLWNATLLDEATSQVWPELADQFLHISKASYPLEIGLEVGYGESFTLDDFREALQDVFLFEVVCHDGVSYTKKEAKHYE